MTVVWGDGRAGTITRRPVTRPAKIAVPASGRRGPHGRRHPVVDPAGRPGEQLHALQNTLASLHLRMGVLAADPTCRWAQPDNIAALQRISEEAMAQALELRATLDGSAPARRKRRARG